MVPPIEPRTQSPQLPQETKPSNVNKMVLCYINYILVSLLQIMIIIILILSLYFLKPDRNQVESRLNQIRDYIRITATMMESLSQSSDLVSITCAIMLCVCV